MASCSTASQLESNCDGDEYSEVKNTPSRSITCFKQPLLQQGKFRNFCHSNKSLQCDLIKPCPLSFLFLLFSISWPEFICPLYSPSQKVHQPHHLPKCYLVRRSPYLDSNKNKKAVFLEREKVIKCTTFICNT